MGQCLQREQIVIDAVRDETARTKARIGFSNQHCRQLAVKVLCCENSNSDEDAIEGDRRRSTNMVCSKRQRVISLECLSTVVQLASKRNQNARK